MRILQSRALALAACLILLPLVSCSGHNSVQAAGAYSNASLSGTYSYSQMGIAANGSFIFDLIGVLTADGKGSVTGGGVNVYITGTTGACPATLGGTYSINANGSGTMSLTITSTTNCVPTATTSYTLQLAQSGSMGLAAESDNLVYSQGTLLKQ
jgi:hypothetical protein